jgi:hypothetical protein
MKNHSNNMNEPCNHIVLIIFPFFNETSLVLNVVIFMKYKQNTDESQVFRER